MATTATPIFTQSPVIGIATVSTALVAKTNIAGTTGLTSLCPVSVNGKRVDLIEVTATGTTASGLVGIWLYNGTTAFLLDELIIPVITGSTTVAAASITRNYSNFNIPSGYQVYASTSVSQTLNVFAFGGDY